MHAVEVLQLSGDGGSQADSKAGAGQVAGCEQLWGLQENLGFIFG